MDVAHTGESHSPNQYEQPAELRSANSGTSAQERSKCPKQARSCNGCSRTGRLPLRPDKLCHDARQEITEQPKPSSVDPFGEIPDEGNRQEIECDLPPPIGVKEQRGKQAPILVVRHEVGLTLPHCKHAGEQELSANDARSRAKPRFTARFLPSYGRDPLRSSELRCGGEGLKLNVCLENYRGSAQERMVEPGRRSGPGCPLPERKRPKQNTAGPVSTDSVSERILSQRFVEDRRPCPL